MKFDPSKAKLLYEQCLEAYKKCRKTPASTMNGMPSPGAFNDEYNVPAELLFNELCAYASFWCGERSAFGWKLVEWVFKRRDWNIEEFSKRESRNSNKKYEIYLELFYKSDNVRQRPFSKPITIDGVRFEWCSKRDYQAAYEAYVEGEQKRRTASGLNYLWEIPDNVVGRRFPKIDNHLEKYIHTIKTTVSSTNSFLGVNSALEKLDILLNCLNVSQGIQKYTVRLSGGSGNRLGSKTVFVTTGHYIVIGDGKTVIYYTDDRILELPREKYSPIAWKKRLFQKMLAGASSDCFLRNRIRNVLGDLNLAYSSTNAGIKILSYWRCLEHATRNSNTNRKEKDIITIFKHRYINQYWKQMGDLVLQSRNQYVHSGIYSGEDEYADQYINWAQKYAEQSLYLLLFLYQNRKIWDSEEKLGAFFDNCAKSDSYIRAVNGIYKIRRL